MVKDVYIDMKNMYSCTYIAQYHKSNICLEGLLNLYSIVIIYAYNRDIFQHLILAEGLQWQNQK